MFLFTHIEKCAGTTFNDILSLSYMRYIHITKNNFGGNEKVNDLTAEQFYKILKYFPSGIGGHSIRPYLKLGDMLKSKPVKLTFLRNPLERYVSQFNHDYERGFTTSFEHFLSRDYCKDFMTTKIGGTPVYEKAKLLLDDFEFIGDANNFNKSINFLQDVMGKKFYANDINKNKRNTKSNYLSLQDLSNKELSKAEENNKNDIKLYEEFILKNNKFKNYSDSLHLKNPKKVRIRLVNKLNKFKKEEIVNPIRKLDK